MVANKISGLILTVCILTAVTLHAQTNSSSGVKCSTGEYKIQTHKNPHFLTPEEINSLESLAQSEATESTEMQAKGMKLLGQRGDSYAAMAEKVLQSDSTFPYALLRKFIRTHWINTVGEDEMNKKFNLVAKQHFKQYVEMIRTGFFPDSDQILNSYLDAARLNGLPDIVVFDAVWAASKNNNTITWEQLNNLPPARIVSPSKVCFNIDQNQADAIIREDFKLFNNSSVGPASTLFNTYLDLPFLSIFPYHIDR